jgi:hypothetical protein
MSSEFEPKVARWLAVLGPVVSVVAILAVALWRIDAIDSRGSVALQSTREEIALLRQAQAVTNTKLDYLAREIEELRRGRMAAARLINLEADRGEQ